MFSRNGYSRTPPYILEDRTGQILATDFDDLYDRIFYKIAQSPGDATKTMIYRMHIRGSRNRDKQPFNSQPIVVLEFGADERLGTVTYLQQPGATTPTPMRQYLRKTSLFGSSLIRKFTASDGQEYVWSHQAVEGHEWTCTTADNIIAAQFELKPPDKLSYDPQVSGNYLTIQEPFFSLTLELLTSFTIMRHIHQHNL